MNLLDYTGNFNMISFDASHKLPPSLGLHFLASLIISRSCPLIMKFYACPKFYWTLRFLPPCGLHLPFLILYGWQALFIYLFSLVYSTPRPAETNFLWPYGCVWFNRLQAFLYFEKLKSFKKFVWLFHF